MDSRNRLLCGKIEMLRASRNSEYNGLAETKVMALSCSTGGVELSVPVMIAILFGGHRGGENGFMIPCNHIITER